LLQAHDTAVTLHAPATVGMHSLLCAGDMCARMIVPLLDCSVLVRASPRTAVCIGRRTRCSLRRHFHFHGIAGSKGHGCLATGDAVGCGGSTAGAPEVSPPYISPPGRQGPARFCNGNGNCKQAAAIACGRWCGQRSAGRSCIALSICS
jgi:hypothetical protein